LTFPVLLDPHETVARGYEVKGLPTLFFIDKDGTISYAQVGCDRTYHLEQILARDLGIDLDKPQKGGSGGGSSD